MGLVCKILVVGCALQFFVFARSASDVAISVVGGNEEIATSFCRRTRNDSVFFDRLRMRGKASPLEKGGIGGFKIPLNLPLPKGEVWLSFLRKGEGILLGLFSSTGFAIITCCESTAGIGYGRAVCCGTGGRRTGVPRQTNSWMGLSARGAHLWGDD